MVAPHKVNNTEVYVSMILYPNISKTNWKIGKETIQQTGNTQCYTKLTAA